MDNMKNASRIFLVAIVLAASALQSVHAQSGEAADEAVRKVFEDRVKTYCRELLPVWWGSKAGMEDPSVRALAADCYLAHARLAILGIPSGLSIKDTSPSEIPALILAGKANMILDIYRPLAGRTIRNQQGAR